jgi:hypothetical protein
MVVQWHASTRGQLKDAYGHGGVVMDVQIRDSAPVAPTRQQFISCC